MAFVFSKHWAPSLPFHFCRITLSSKVQANRTGISTVACMLCLGHTAALHSIGCLLQVPSNSNAIPLEYRWFIHFTKTANACIEGGDCKLHSFIQSVLQWRITSDLLLNGWVNEWIHACSRAGRFSSGSILKVDPGK